MVYPYNDFYWTRINCPESYFVDQINCGYILRAFCSTDGTLFQSTIRICTNGNEFVLKNKISLAIFSDVGSDQMNSKNVISIDSYIYTTFVRKRVQALATHFSSMVLKSLWEFWIFNHHCDLTLHLQNNLTMVKVVFEYRMQSTITIRTDMCLNIYANRPEFTSKLYHNKLCCACLFCVTRFPNLKKKRKMFMLAHKKCFSSELFSLPKRWVCVKVLFDYNWSMFWLRK